MNTLTLRKIPIPVEQRLRRIAKDTHKSINKTVIDLLSKSVGLEQDAVKPKKHRDVRSVLRVWSNEEYEEFKRNTQVFEQIDEEMWRT